MDPLAVASLYGIGAGVLALWLVARFPGRGPKTVRRAAVLLGLAVLLEPAANALTELVRHAAGVPAALLVVVLPFLTFLFWAAAALLLRLSGLLAAHSR